MLENFKIKTKNTEDWLKKEISTIRTGRASSTILDSIFVDSYGSRLPINQIANIIAEDARTLRIVPWNQDQIKAIETAIKNAGLGLSVNTDEKGLRIIFPELTSETRTALLKLAKLKLEEARISIKKEREGVWGDIQKKEREGDMTEDEKFRLRDEIQKIVDDTNKELEEIYNKKEKEIEV